MCWISYRNEYVGLLVLCLLVLSKPRLIIDIKSFITLVDVHLNLMNWFHFAIFVGDLLIIVIGCMVFLSPFLDVVIRMFMSIVSFFVQLGSGILYLQNVFLWANDVK